MSMAGFRFLFADLQQEIIALKKMAESFFDSQTSFALEGFLTDLKSIGNQQGETAHTLNLQPLRTIPSEGEYEAGYRKGGRNIYAVISGTWELRPLGRRPAPKREIEFCGNASTKIELYAVDEPETRLAMWRMELGAEDSPGCYVHAQILGDSNNPPFPKSVPIPRLPSIFVTPMSAVEFVLGELFQDKWKQRTFRNTGDTYKWNRLQGQWLQSLFSWYQNELRNSYSSSSPWMTLKTAKPDGTLFIAK